MIKSLVVLSKEQACPLSVFEMTCGKKKESLKHNYVGQTFFFLLILFLCMIELDFK